MYFVYILECSDGTYYTGFTNNITRRVKAHNNGRGARYTKGRLPVTLRYVEVFKSRRDALRREADIKTMSHSQKSQLIESCPPPPALEMLEC